VHINLIFVFSIKQSKKVENLRKYTREKRKKSFI
jgi:hypothetical protein